MNWLLSLYPGDTAALTVLTVCVQLAVLVALAWTLAQTLGRRNPAALYGVWLCALICVPVGTLGVWAFSRGGVTLIALPWLSPEADEPLAADDGNAAAQATSSMAPADAAASASSPLTAWFTNASGAVSRVLCAANTYRAAFVVVEIVWLLGIVYFVARLVRGFHILAQLTRELRPVNPRRLGDVPARVCRALGMRRFPLVMVSRRVTSPISLGLWRPTIVMPEGLISSLDARQLHDVLVHECAHFLKRDHATGVLERAIQIVFWLHPAVYVLSQELAKAREELCDNYVLRGGNVPDYARTLLFVSQRAGRTRPTYSSAIGFLQGPRRLEVRVRSLLDKRRKLVTRMNSAAFGLLALAFVVTAATIAGTRLVPAERPVPLVQTAVVTMTPPLEPAAELAALKAPAVLPIVVPERPFVAQPSSEPLVSTAVASEPRPAVEPIITLPAAQPAVVTRLETPSAPTAKKSPADVAPRAIEKVAAKLARPAGKTPLRPAPQPALPMVSMGEVTGQLQPALRVEPESGVYWVNLRMGDEAGTRVLVEPGKPRKVVYEESLTARIALELLVEEDAGAPEFVRASYRLSVQFAPDVVAYWESQGAAVRVRQWNVLAPGMSATPLAADESDPPPELVLFRLQEARRLLAIAMKMLSDE